MLTVVTWKWIQKGGRAKFDSSHVNTVYNMIDRNYSGDWRMICVTDDAKGLRPEIVAVPLPKLWDDIPNPVGPEYPSCYRRLCLFDPDFQRYLTGRFVSVDLDCVITGPIDSLWDRDDAIVFWESPIRAPDYNGSMWMAKAGVHHELFTEFDPYQSPILSQRARKLGSDQGWFSYRLPGKPVWTKADGVYAWNPQLRNRNYRLPPNARIVFFPGIDQPWHTAVKEKAGWVREHYR